MLRRECKPYRSSVTRRGNGQRRRRRRRAGRWRDSVGIMIAGPISGERISEPRVIYQHPRIHRALHYVRRLSSRHRGATRGNRKKKRREGGQGGGRRENSFKMLRGRLPLKEKGGKKRKKKKKRKKEREKRTQRYLLSDWRFVCSFAGGRRRFSSSRRSRKFLPRIPEDPRDP
jgi:hypothetical protein